MDNEDYGRNNPPFRRYVPSCYGKYQKYIPSFYMMENDGSPDKDNEKSDTTKVNDVMTDKSVSVSK